MPRSKPKDHSLERYRQKRDADRTPEPFGSAQADRPRVFVMHKHRASRLHYDLRLELGGVLKSWAVPKGPSFDPAVKRMAVFVEDHPVEYTDFEGLIPEGNYGAGAMIVWDRGVWEPLEDPEEGLVKGKILFELKGYKLRGVWTLVRTKGSEKDWLLIKKPDAYSGEEGTRPVGQESILSGLTVEELQEGKTKDAQIRTELERIGAPKRRVHAARQQVMLAETAEAPFSKAGWVFELKYDGFRLLLARENGEPQMYYRRGSNSTKTFPDLARAVAKLPYGDLIIDGEVVVLDDDARPSFQRLQRRVQLIRPQDIERAAVVYPATYYAFDLLAFEGWDLRELPLLERKRLLQMLLPKTGPLRYSDHVLERGAELFREVEKLRLEGIVAKKANAPYRSGRSADWMKVRVDHTGDFVVVGFSEPKESRTGFGALNLALWRDGELVYVGRAGSGFSGKLLDSLSKQLLALERKTPPCGGTLPTDGVNHWVEPELVAEVRYKEITEDGLLRQPVFLRLRDDKGVKECVMDASFHARTPIETAAEEEAAEVEAPPEAPPVAEASGERKVPFTNLTKTFWPEEKYTKGDLIEYYRRISPWILPYLRDRLLVLTRYPDGIAGKSFFQKDAPPFVPGWVRTERMWSEHASREIDYFVADDVESLLFVINMGSIPLHVWSSRMADLQHPDWCILDLDPKKAPFSSVVRVALAIRTLCEEIELECFIKTSGSTGLHVLLPLGNQLTYEQSRSLGELVSRIIVEELPEISTTTRNVGARGTRVYLDYLQNGHGRLLVAPLCVRPVPGALVSMPLSWSEVTPDLDFKRFTIQTAPERMASLPEDPMVRVMSVKPDLAGVLARLSKRFKR